MPSTITIKSGKENFQGTSKFLKAMKKPIKRQILEKYGALGVNALASNTPVDTGLTSQSWSYKISESDDGIITLSFHNSNVQQHVNIAMILQFGHATRNGGWVEGRNYITPAIRPILDKLAKAAWKEVELTIG